MKLAAFYRRIIEDLNVRQNIPKKYEMPETSAKLLMTSVKKELVENTTTLVVTPGR